MKKEKLTDKDFLDTQEFTSKLSEKFSGIIPKKLFDNMYGLQGYGGTGKTTMTKKLLDDIQKQSGNAYSGITTKFVAPTHQASTQLMESLGIDSEDISTRVKTVASYLRMQVQGRSNQLGDEQKWSLTPERSYITRVKKYPREAVGNPSVIIIDEASISDLVLSNKLVVNIIATSSLINLDGILNLESKTTYYLRLEE